MVIYDPKVPNIFFGVAVGIIPMTSKTVIGLLYSINANAVVVCL